MIITILQSTTSEKMTVSLRVLFQSRLQRADDSADRFLPQKTRGLLRVFSEDDSRRAVETRRLLVPICLSGHAEGRKKRETLVLFASPSCYFETSFDHESGSRFCTNSYVWFLISAEPVWRNGRAWDSGSRSSGFEFRKCHPDFPLGKENNRHRYVAQFAGNTHWAEPSPLFPYRARPTPLKCKN